MKRFIYKGQQAHNSTIVIEQPGEEPGTKVKSQIDLRLSPGEEYDLDETHDVIKSLVDRAYLVESETGKQTSQTKKS